MNLSIRKIIVLSLVGIVFLLGNVLVIANWVAEMGISEKANWFRQEFLTGTALCVIVTLLILLVSPKSSRGGGLGRRCPVCDEKLLREVKYCNECGSRV